MIKTNAQMNLARDGHDVQVELTAQGLTIRKIMVVALYTAATAEAAQRKAVAAVLDLMMHETAQYYQPKSGWNINEEGIWTPMPDKVEIQDHLAERKPVDLSKIPVGRIKYVAKPKSKAKVTTKKKVGRPPKKK